MDFNELLQQLDHGTAPERLVGVVARFCALRGLPMPWDDRAIEIADTSLSELFDAAAEALGPLFPDDAQLEDLEFGVLVSRSLTTAGAPAQA
jgi:hypothetical protein